MSFPFAASLSLLTAKESDDRLGQTSAAAKTLD